MAEKNRTVRDSEKEKEEWLTNAMPSNRAFISKGDLETNFDGCVFDVSMYLGQPCSEDTEDKIAGYLSGLPLFATAKNRLKDPILFEAFSEQSCEAIHFSTNHDGEPTINSYYFPAGMTLNLAMQCIGNKLGTKKPLQEWNARDFEAAQNRYLAMATREGEDVEGGFFTLRNLPNLLSALLLESANREKARHNHARQKYGEYLKSDKPKPFIPQKISGDYISTLLSDISLRPATIPNEARLATAIVSIPVGGTDLYPREIRCLTDILYYSFLSFTVRRNHNALRKCPICKRLFFVDHASESYCLFRCPEIPALSCKEAKVRIHAKDEKFVKKNEKIKDRIESRIRNRIDKRKAEDNELIDFQDEYRAYHHEVAANLYHHEMCNEWLTKQDEGYRDKPIASASTREEK